MAGNPPSSGAPSLRPPAVGSMVPQGFGPYTMQHFRPAAPPQPGQPFIPQSAPQQFHPAGQAQMGMPPGQSPHLQYSQPMQQIPPRPGQAPQMPPQSAAPGPGMSFSSPYTFTPSAFGEHQNSMNIPQFQPPSQMHAPMGSVASQPWLQTVNQTTTPLQQSGQQGLTASATVPAVSNPSNPQQTVSDWQEYEAADGRRYYFNKVTKQSSWEKPLELMTPLERADASTVWKEFTTAEGRKYYYNKETKQSKWTIPEELKLAREQAEREAAAAARSEETATPTVVTAATATSVEQSSSAVASVSSSTATIMPVVGSSPVPVTPVPADANAASVAVSGSSVVPAVTATGGTYPMGEAVSPLPSAASLDATSTPLSNVENPSHVGASPLGGASSQDIEEAKKRMAVAGKINVTPAEDKSADDDRIIYANKQEAKNAFKALLESANVGADWTWEQAMRVIINDKRYGALNTLGERKQAFNEYLMQRKKLEAEERRVRQRKAKEEFTKMLEEAKELTSSTRWSKAVAMFEDDERFKAVEREADREDLFRNYLVDLQKKEKAKAQEEYRQNRLEYRQFLETCGFIKVDSQWRKVQDLLEDDERCSRLDKLDRLEIFQEYIRDLEKEEEEQRRREKEQLRRAERKNRDAFRKMMEEHIASGIFTAKTRWRDYCLKVRDSEAYQAVALNTSGSTPKDLFEDVAEELENKYYADKTRIKDALKQEKITVASSWTFEDFKSSIRGIIDSSSISDINLELIFEDLIERAKEKEEKEAKKRQRLAKDLTEKLSTIKEIDASSTWEDCKQLIEDSSEYRAMGEESLCREVFEEYVVHLQEKAKEKERKREEEKAKKDKEREEKEKRKDREKREKDKEKEKDRDKDREKEKDKTKERTRKDDADSESADITDSHGHRDEKRREKDRERKHRKRHHSGTDDVSSDKDDKDDSKKSRRSDRKKSRKHAHSPESDGESRHKKHRREHRDGSRQNGGHQELEDGELGEDGEIE